MPRKRSTRAEIISREHTQAQIVANLVLLGADDVAAHVTACWHDRLFGNPITHRYRCRSVSCSSCRGPSLNAWWRAFLRFSNESGATSYLRLAVDDPLTEVTALSKSLRNMRDRSSRDSWLFEDLGFVGLCDGYHLHVLASHPGLSRRQLGERLHALWPEVVLEDAPTDPLAELSPRLLASLGAVRRGLQPLRFVISPRGC